MWSSDYAHRRDGRNYFGSILRIQKIYEQKQKRKTDKESWQDGACRVSLAMIAFNFNNRKDILATSKQSEIVDEMIKSDQIEAQKECLLIKNRLKRYWTKRWKTNNTEWSTCHISSTEVFNHFDIFLESV